MRTGRCCTKCAEFSERQMNITSASTTTSSSPSSPHSSSHNVATGWAGSKGKSSAKYATISNSAPQLPLNLSNAFDFTGNTVSSVPWKEQRESQDSVASEVTMDTLDEEENDSSGPRTRTQSTLRAIGSMMLGASSRSRGNTSTNDYGSTPTTPTRRTKMPASPAPSPGPGKLSRRSSSFFPPTPKFDKTEFVAAAGGGPTGTLPSRMRKGSVGNLKALISTPLELQRQMEEERNRPPHLSMIIPGGSLGDLLTSPTSSSSRISSSSGNGAQPLSPRPRPSLPSSSHGSDSTATPQLPSRDSGSTITLNKRWSVASGSSKRWSGTGSSKTASGRSSKRQSWSEQLLSLTGTTAIQLVHASTSTSGMASGSDNRGASKTSLAASGSSSDGSSGGLPARSKTPIADLFRGGSTSLDVDRATAARSKPDLKASSSVASFSAKVNAQEEPESVRRRRSGTLPAFSTFAPLSLSMFDEPGARSGNVTRSAAPPSSYTTSSSTNYPMQRAIDALAMLQQQQPTSPATVGVTPVSKSHGLTLQVPGATDENDGRAPRPSLSGGSPVVRKKHWSRTGDASGSLSVNTATGRPSSSGGRSAESSTKAAATSASNSPLLSIGASAPSTSGEDDWTSSVLAAAHISPTISVNNSGSLSSPLSAASAATVTPFSSVPIASSKSMPTSPAKATPTSSVPSPVSVASTATVTAPSPKSTPSSSSATVNLTSVPTSPTQRAPTRKLSEAILNASAIPDGTVRDARRMFESQSQSQAGGRSPTSPKKTRAPIPDAFTSSTR
ncbi:hypothetical protein DL93DRAFT_289904 [Clavulina sp. PMI_390]|nr:hypothetical protein DL93DRAFT_289904 [Clavulina sp. PMI_390]